MLSRQTALAKQNAILRYVISTSPDTTARDFNVSRSSLTQFLNTPPETLRSKTRRFSVFLESNPKQVALEHNRTIVKPISGVRYQKLSRKQNKSETEIRRFQAAKATRTKKKSIVTGHYIPIEKYNDNRKSEVFKAYHNLSGKNGQSIMSAFNAGIISENEAQAQLVALWRSSGQSASGANKYFDTHKET